MAVLGTALPQRTQCRFTSCIAWFVARLSDDLHLILQGHREALADAIQGMEPAPHRRTYAQVLLNRCLLLHGLQCSGWLGTGDDWYVQNLLGHSQSQGYDRFYRNTLKPLLYQGLGLPEGERPLAVNHPFGPLPYLGSVLFSPHPLEAKYPQLDLPDEPFEALLAWLAEQGWTWQEQDGDRGPGLTPERLAIAFEGWINGPPGKPQISTPEQLAKLGDRTIYAYVLAEIHRHTGQDFSSIEALTTALTDDLCALLVTQILPKVTVLDPACGSGRFLLMALGYLKRLHRICLNQAKSSQNRGLTAWRQSLQADSLRYDWAITCQIITQNLYGVDLNPAAIDIARTQLALALLATASTPAPLPPLTMHLQVGNSLIGLIQVDEAGFDQVPSKKSAAPPPDGRPETALQGNLLQPLAAESYRTILTEKYLRTEEYRAQTQAFAETRTLPPFLQGEFLRDRLTSLAVTAQTKLNQLLFNEFSQTLGVRVSLPQGPGRPRRRLLTVDDIAVLNPFHWGFHYHDRFTELGGFDVVLTQSPKGTLRPNSEAFYYRYQTQLAALDIDLKTFKKNRQHLLLLHGELAQNWATYGGEVAYCRQYFCRSRDYAIAAQGTTRKALYLWALFTRRCEMLTQPQGITAVV